MSFGPLQRDLEAAYQQASRIEDRVASVDLEMKVAEARGEAAVVAVLQQRLEYELMELQQARRDIAAIREAIQQRG